VGYRGARSSERKKKIPSLFDTSVEGKKKHAPKSDKEKKYGKLTLKEGGTKTKRVEGPGPKGGGQKPFGKEKAPYNHCKEDSKKDKKKNGKRGSYGLGGAQKWTRKQKPRAPKKWKRHFWGLTMKLVLPRRTCLKKRNCPNGGKNGTRLRLSKPQGAKGNRKRKLGKKKSRRTWGTWGGAKRVPRQKAKNLKSKGGGPFRGGKNA